jgi:hypothetical protein
MLTLKQNTIACEAIKELVEVTMRSRKDTKRAKELREKAKKEALRLYKAKQWEVGTDQAFEGATIRLYHERVYSWEKNHQIEDALIDIYRSQLEHIGWLENQLKRSKEELKMTCHNLEMAYPNSESIKQELRLQIR